MRRYNENAKGVISDSLLFIRRGVASGTIPVTAIEVQDGERLDHIAHRFYGDGQLWWVIAAASNIGWWLQVPPGTRLFVPDANVLGS